MRKRMHALRNRIRDRIELWGSRQFERSLARKIESGAEVNLSVRKDGTISVYADWPLDQSIPDLIKELRG